MYLQNNIVLTIPLTTLLSHIRFSNAMKKVNKFHYVVRASISFFMMNLHFLMSDSKQILKAKHIHTVTQCYFSLVI
jgi:hypothetical protein